jgi:hypothetical protein
MLPDLSAIARVRLARPDGVLGHGVAFHHAPFARDAVEDLRIGGIARDRAQQPVAPGASLVDVPGDTLAECCRPARASSLNRGE